VAVRQAALAHQRHDGRQATGLDELEQLGARVGVEDAAARVDDRLPRLGDRLRGLADLPLVHLRRRPPARQVDLVGIDEVELRLLHVLRDVDEHRAGTPRPRDVERVLHHLRQLAHVLHEPGVLDDRQRDAGRVGLLEGVGADQVRVDLPGDRDERSRVHPGVGDRGDEVRRAGAGGCDRDTGPAGGARVSLSHVAGALFVAGEDVPDGRAAGDCVVGRQDGAARDAEHHLDALRLE
jgi:hypothetical protein